MSNEPIAPLSPSARSRRPAKRRRKVMRWVKRGSLIVLGAGIVIAIVSAWWPKPIVVDVAVIRRQSLQVEVAEDGRTRVRDRFIVSAPITGNLTRITLDPGAAVERGGVIARIEPPDPALLDERTRNEAKARLSGALARQRQAETAIVRGKVARDAAVREADRTRTLVKTGAVTVSELDRMQLSEQLAIQDLAAAELARSVAAADVAATRAILGGGGRGGATSVAVISPAAGQVLRVVRDSAGPVAAGTPLVEIGDPHAIEAVVDVLSSDAAQIAPGMAVTLEAWGGDHGLRGHVKLVEPSAFTKVSALGVEEQRVNVIVALDPDPVAPPVLGDGFRVEARIILWRGDNVPVMPSTAVFRDRGSWAVYTVEAGRARLRPIEVGHRGRTEVELVRGLPEGARIILHPGDRIADGVRVDVL